MKQRPHRPLWDRRSIFQQVKEAKHVALEPQIGSGGSKDSMSKLTNVLEQMVRILTVGAVVIYGSGFLIVATFMDRFGVIGAGVEFLKVKYIIVGMLFMLFPCGLLAPISIMLFLRDHPDTKIKTPIIALFNLGNLLTVCYWFATFSDSGHFYEKRYYIISLFAWTIFAITCSRRFANIGSSQSRLIDNIGPFIDRVFRNPPILEKYRKDIIRFVSITGIVFLDYLIVPEIGLIALLFVGNILIGLFSWHFVRGTQSQVYSINRLATSLYLARIPKVGRNCLSGIITVGLICVDLRLIGAFNDGWGTIKHIVFYYFLCSLIAFYLWNARKRLFERYGPSAQPAAWVIIFCLAGGLCYMSMLAFAYGVFPQIPFAKGGGNYEDVPDVEIYWKEESLKALPKDLPFKSNRFTIIEETPTTVFVADPEDPQGTGFKGWRFWKTPRVIALKRDDITAIVHLSLQGGKENILFVHDGDARADGNRAILERLGYNVTATTNIKKALELFTGNPKKYDIVISDQAMQNSGVRLAEKMFKVRKDIPVILCTCYTETASQEEAKAAGISECLTKPVAKKELAGAVRRVLDQRKKDSAK
jgi:CheY-like chemotaxis protein